MQELSNAIIEFFDLVIEKYITHFSNPKREWNYFKTLLQTANIDLNRIQSYLKVLKNSSEQPTIIKVVEPVKLDNYLTYISPLRDHNRPIDFISNQKFENTSSVTNYLSQPRLEQNNDQTLLFKKITSKIVNLMESNNIPMALTKEIHRPLERKYTEYERFKFTQQLSF